MVVAVLIALMLTQAVLLAFKDRALALACEFPLNIWGLKQAIGCQGFLEQHLPPVGLVIEKSGQLAQDLADTDFPLAFSVMRSKLAFDEIALVLEHSSLSYKDLLSERIGIVTVATMKLVEELSKLMVDFSPSPFKVLFIKGEFKE